MGCSINVSFDCVSAGCGVLFIFKCFPLFRSGEAEDSIIWRGMYGSRSLFLLHSPEARTLGGGVVKCSSWGDSKQSPLKSVGLGDGFQPAGQAPLRSRTAVNRPFFYLFFLFRERAAIQRNAHEVGHYS